MKLGVWLPIILLFTIIGCDPEKTKLPSQETSFTRPVTILKLKKSNPNIPLRLTGNVESWKQENISFEVGGRLIKVIDSGVDVKGPIKDIDGKLVSPGTLLAKISPESYKLQVASAKAEIEALKKKLTTESTIQYLIPAQIAEAKANKTLAEKELARQQKLQNSSGFTQANRDKAQADYDKSLAKIAQIEADKKVKQASIATIEAKIQKAEEVLKQANLDVKRCDLYTTYDGRVSAVHVISGGYVQPGQAIVTNILMDPIRITAAVSAETDRQIHLYDPIEIFSPSYPDPIIGWVQFKDTVADPTTRTFKIQILTRNFKTPSELLRKPELSKVPRISDLLPIVTPQVNKPGKWYVEEKCLYQESDGSYYVWQTDRNAGEAFKLPLIVNKCPVTPGRNLINLLGIYQFREIIVQKSDPVYALIQQKALLAAGVPAEVKEGDPVVMTRENWLFRPGDLVQVELESKPIEKGFYVPMAAILEEQEKHYVFLVEQRGPTKTAKKIKVKLIDHVGEKQRIEAKELVEGAKLILEGVHYLLPNEKIEIVKELESHS